MKICRSGDTGRCRSYYFRGRTSDGSAENSRSKSGETCADRFVRKSARVIFRYWEKKYKRQPDLVVIEGPLAGGHLGFSVEELEMYEQNVEICAMVL